MTVENISRAMLDFLSESMREKEAVLTNRQYADEFKKQKTRELFAARIPGAENLGVNLVGAPYEAENGQTWASETGALWAELSFAERARHAARDASGAFSGDAGYWCPRVKSLLTLAGVPGGVAELYEAATDLEKIALQDFGPGLLPATSEYAALRSRFDRDARARRNDAKVQAADAALERLFDQIEAALVALRYLTDEFGRESSVLPLLSRLYRFERNYIAPSIDYPQGGMTRVLERVAYGLVFTPPLVYSAPGDNSR